MQIYKFGGASIATPERMKALVPIIEQAKTPLAVVVSAYGKTTNALEAIVHAVLNGHKDEADQLLLSLEKAHNDYAADLVGGNALAELYDKLQTFYTEIQWALEDAPTHAADYIYDQVVSIGELLSTSILSAYLQHIGILNQWLDARDLLRTDETYRDAHVDIEYSQKQVQQKLIPALQQTGLVITQGFIGGSSDNNSTTLGREGSDYSAALFAAMTKAESLSIWKDVPGLLNADPRLFPNTVKIDEITYHEVIEMAYYGAQVIHPKTIKPLQNAGIPMYVRCFLQPELKGTRICQTSDTFVYPPIIVLKAHQVLLQITSRDFSFITEDNLSKIYNIFHGQNVKINLIQNAAISLVLSVDHREEKVNELMRLLETDYKVLRNDDVQLLTVRHYTPSLLEELTKGRVILLEQKTRNTVQLIVK